MSKKVVSKSASKQVNEMKDLKKHILEDKLITVFGADMPDIKNLGVFLLTKVIPEMDKNNELAFTWYIRAKDVAVYNKKEYEQETKRYKDMFKMKCCIGDATWFYDFKNKEGKMRRCIMNTEIWYEENKEHSLSPMALLFNQFTSNGLHITKCKFIDA